MQEAYSIVIREQKEKRLADMLKRAEDEEDDIECTIESLEQEDEEL